MHQNTIDKSKQNFKNVQVIHKAGKKSEQQQQKNPRKQKMTDLSPNMHQ